MSTTRVTMPQLGESVHEGTIAKWLVKPGDKVVEFEPMLEVDTDKVSAEVPAPVTGVLKEIIAKEGETVQAGAEIAVVEVDGDAPSPQSGEGRGGVGEGRRHRAARKPTRRPTASPAFGPATGREPRQDRAAPARGVGVSPTSPQPSPPPGAEREQGFPMAAAIIARTTRCRG